MSDLIDSSQLSDILNKEQRRLSQKKQEIDAAVNGQNRLIQFNDSYNQRYIYYLKIMIIIVSTLVLFFGLKYISENVDFVPDWIIDLANVIIFSLAFFGIYYTTVDILQRDNMDFNEIKAPPPQTLTTEEIAARQQAALESGNLLGSLTGLGCSGMSCCGSDTMWDTTTNLCHMPGYKFSAPTTAVKGTPGPTSGVTSVVTLRPTSVVTLRPTSSGITSGPTSSGITSGPTSSGITSGPTSSGITSGPTSSGITSGPTSSGITSGATSSGITSVPSITTSAPSTMR